MSKFALKHLTNDNLRRGLKSALVTDRASTANVIAYVAEYDDRKLYLPDGYSSMFEYCVDELGMSEDQACNRIEVARKARQFPILFDAIEDGRLNLSTIRELGPHLTSSNAESLVADASGLRIRDLRIQLARRFPRAEEMRLDDGVTVLPTTTPATDLSATSRIDPLPQNPVKPLSPNRYALDFGISQAAHDKMRYFQSLLGSNDLESAFERALEIAIPQVEKRKFGACTKPRQRDKRSPNPRYVPKDVRRAVWMRDQGRCTFVSNEGRRCTVVGSVEFDHATPVAHGGKATVDNLRLLCRAHNQYEAVRLLGADFMEKKRERSERFQDVAAALRRLRAKPTEARLAAEHALTAAPEAPLEEQIRVALQWFRPAQPRELVTA